tara:strand:- start:179527 stop:180027 length:501 start_codon:yes stop_codon:yes gene_type:complete
MKNTFVKTKLFLMGICAVLTLSCSSEDGNDGAIGPQGIQGEQGPDGEDGNANVTSILFEDQTILIGNNDFAIPQLTQEIFDNGVVLAYLKGTDGSWQPLPLIQEGNIALDIDRISVGNIRLTATFTSLNLNFRFILIKGNLTGKNAEMDFSKMSYVEVMDYFGLEH